MALLSQTFIADGFGDDCDELIHQCLKEVPVTYSGFAKVFSQMQMSCVFLNRQSGAEIAELSEELISVAKYYMMGNSNNYETSVVGLFLVYALVKLQPFENYAYLRISVEDVQYIERIELVARRGRRMDVLYVLGTILVQHTRYCAAERERGMEPSYRKYLENFTAQDSQRPKGVFLRQNEELDIIKELSEIQLRYDAVKLTANVPELHYVDQKFAKELNSSLKNIVSGLIETDDDECEEEEEVRETARDIKDRAMKIKVNPMRHLQGVTERSPTKSTISNIKTSPGKIKTGTLTKPLTSNKPNKAERKLRPQKRKMPSITSDESDISLDLSDDADSDMQSYDDCNEDIDLHNFNKGQTTTAKDETTHEVEVHVPDLKLGDLPCLITSEDNGLSYEIEIIDQTNKSIGSSTATPGPKPVFKTDNDLLLKKEKKDLKKTILKSRFKRMGMEPIANFKKPF